MTCQDVLEQIEALAAREIEPGADLLRHLETCPQCAGALADARRIETLLAGRPAPDAPPRFAAAVQQRIRRERWQAEQRIDRLFNVAIVSAALLIVAAGLFFLRGGLLLEGAAAVSAALTRVGTQAVEITAPSLGTYVAATGLLVSGFVMWWWAEEQ